MLYVISLGLFLPLMGFLILLITSDKIERHIAQWIACGTILTSFLCFSILFYFYTKSDLDFFTFFFFNWIPNPGIQADFTLRLDALSLLMSLIITGVGFLIHVYSIGYMDHEEDYARYFACMNFFIFAMLLLVLAGNLLLLFVGWEGVGLASYLLIGFWYHRPAAAQAATKAFVVNRIGDWGLLIGLLLTFYLFGTSDIEQIFKRVEQGFTIQAPLLTVLTLLYFWGATGKSAQIPLYTWLPDAMEGPTPVSALIHAATMVTAGVYLVVRMHPIFMLTPTTLLIIGHIGAATALFAAMCALSQKDLKRVLAYSTISQLGLMFLACGVGAFYAAVFHLTTHAFVKALLFLSAGNVIHMMSGITDMDKMGGLSKIFTKTHWLFLIGVLALSGIPPLAPFFSKDLILEEEHAAGFDFLFYIGLLTSILTAFYLTRAYCLTFTGQSRLEEKILKRTKEAPTIMLIPVMILAFLSMTGGFLGYAFGKTSILESLLAKTDLNLNIDSSTNLFLLPETWLSIIGALLGIGLSALIYRRFIDNFKKPISLFKNAFYIDKIYWNFIARPLEAVARFIANTFEPKVFDGSIQAIVKGTQKTAQEMQRIQNGQIRSYAAWMVIGAALLIVYFIF